MRKKMKKIEITSKYLDRADIYALSQEFECLNFKAPNFYHLEFLRQPRTEAENIFFLQEDNCTIIIDSKSGQWVILKGHWTNRLIRSVLNCNRAIENYNSSNLNYSKQFWLKDLIGILEGHVEAENE